MTGESRWSWRLRPTPGRSARTSMPSAASSLGGPDAREQEQLGRLHRAGADDDLALGAKLRDAPSRATSTPLQRSPSKSSRRAWAPVSTVRFGAAAIGARNAVALLWRTPVLDVERTEGDAVQGLAVVVVVERDARLLCGGDDGGIERVRLVARADVQGAARPVVGRRAAVEVLGPLEERKHVLVAPAIVADVGPRVVIAAMPARVDHPVERAGPPQHPAPRPVQLAAGAGRLGHGPVAPVLLAVPQLEQPRRLVDGGVVVALARLEQGDARSRIDQAAGHDGPAGSGSHHDHVGDRRGAVSIPCHHRNPPARAAGERPAYAVGLQRERRRE